MHKKQVYHTLGGLNGYVSGIFISSWYRPPKKKMGKQIWECWSTLICEIKYNERLFQNKYHFVLSAEKIKIPK